MKYGLLLEPKPTRDFEFDLCCSANDITVEDLPEEFEIPLDKLPPVYNQEFYQACGGFSMVECVEGKDLRDGKDLIHYSPFYNYGRVESRNDYPGEGLFMSTALKGLCKIGVVPMLYFDTKAEMPELKKILDERDDLVEVGKLNAPNSFVSPYSGDEDRRWNQIRLAIYKYRYPVIICSRNYFNGGHAIVAYGWTKTKGKRTGRYIKFQNHWGVSYGINGRSAIPISEIDEAYLPLWDEIKLPFVDIKKDDWFYDEVKSGYCCGLIKGTSDTTFEPESNIIRGDVALILSRLMDKSEEYGNLFVTTKIKQGKKASNFKFATANDCKKTFIDVAPTDYYMVAIKRMAANGIIEGNTENEYNPTDFITRAEFAALCVRYLEKYKIILNKALKYSSCNVEIQKFTPVLDLKESDWWFEVVGKALRYGLMQGDDTRKFRPESYITRAEATTVLNRLFKQSDNLLRQFI